MGIFEKLKKAKQPAPKSNVGSEKVNEIKISEAELRKTLKGFLYGEDLVEEMLPTFRKLYDGHPEFKEVVELIQAKEKELNNINEQQGYFNQDSNPNDDPEKTSDNTEDEEGGKDYLMEILESRYGE